MTGQEFLESLEFIDNDLIEESNLEMGKPKGIFLKKIVVAANILLCMCTVALGCKAAVENEWTIAIINYMGLSNANTTQLANGMVQINVSDTKTVLNQQTEKKEVITFTVESSVGDQRNAVIYIKTNIKVPENFDETRDYFMPEIWETAFQKRKNGISTSSGGQLESLIEDGYLTFMMQVRNVEHLNTSYVNITLGDIYLYHDLNMEDGGKQEELIYSDTWNMSWKYSYKTNSVTKKMNKSIPYKDGKCKIKRIEITPMSIEINCKVSFFEEDYNLDNLDITAITLKSEKGLKESTILNLKNGVDGGGGSRDWSFGKPYRAISAYKNFDSIGVVVNPKDVVAVTINGVELEVGKFFIFE